MPTDSLRDAAFCDVLNRELVCALGCTEPIAVAYAAALASQALGCEPDHMDVACSGNIIKNVKSVTVPNSGGMHGIEAAAVLGAVGGDAKSALEVLERAKDKNTEYRKNSATNNSDDIQLQEQLLFTKNLEVGRTAKAHLRIEDAYRK